MHCVGGALVKRKILVPLNQGFAARYLLQTDVIQTLLEDSTIEVVLLVPDPDHPFFEKLSSHPRVSLETYRMEECQKFFNQSKLEQKLFLVLKFVLNGHFDMRTTADHFDEYIKDGKERFSGFKGGMKRVAFKAVIHLLRRSRILRKAILWMEHAFCSPRIHDEIFRRVAPDRLLVTSLGTIDYDQYLMREARLHHIPVTSVVLSWDNTTSRGMPGAIPDQVITWTEQMKQEVIELNDI